MKNESQLNLSLMLADMEKASPEFTPTNFWRSGLSTIIDDIEKYGLENFREHKSATRFEVRAPFTLARRCGRQARPCPLEE